MQALVDLPSAEERAQILSIHLKSRGRKARTFDIAALAEAASGFSGAELEQAIVDALFEAFARGAEIRGADVMHAIRATVPLSKTMAEPITALREWAKTRCVPADVKSEPTKTTNLAAAAAQ